MTNLEKYQSLAGNIPYNNFARPYVFYPKKDDYSNPYIRRYFVKKINDNDIIEVSGENYKTLSAELYVMISMKWKISGPTATLKDGSVFIEGIIEFNQKQVRDAEKTMPGISKRLKNMLEGYK
jgi:hypothetical protein